MKTHHQQQKLQKYMLDSIVRTQELRALMSNAGIDAYVIVNSDPHQSEYLPDHWKCVEWLTGFRGEVATVIITQTEALLWTDSRFFISGTQQLEGSPFELKKMKIDPPVVDWLKDYQNTDINKKIGGDKRVIFGDLADLITLDLDLISQLWKDRPSMPQDKVTLYPDKYNGESASSKIARIIDIINTGDSTNGILLTALDDIAWTLNLRGSDIHCTPVFTSYLLLSRPRKVLYINAEKTTDEVRTYLAQLNVDIEPYEDAPIHTKTLRMDGMDIILADNNPVPLMKAIKNDVEIEGYKRAMLKDGIALTKFYHWLESALDCSNDGKCASTDEKEITELDCVEMLKTFRQEQDGYMDESFDAIVAWNEHGALPHYEPRVESNVPISGDGLLLIDTGGHYLDGTTDITRTIGIGNVSAAMKRDYTLVLKGHVRLAQAVFPRGTRGDQLDVLARMDLWRDGKTYRHGTSHGVGHYLGVHEGPESVRMEYNPQVLIEGMFFSNEPAIYLNGKYGIRHENCVLVRPFDIDTEAPESTPCDQDEHGDYLSLDTLTLCYIDTSCIDTRIMNEDEIEWLNNYNQRVYETLSPHLEEIDRLWLGVKCQAIYK